MINFSMKSSDLYADLLIYKSGAFVKYLFFMGIE